MTRAYGCSMRIHMLLEKIGDNGPMCGDNDICKSNETYKRDLHDLWRETYTEDQ